MEVAAAKQLLPMARGGPNSPSSSTSSSSPSSAAASASPSPRQQSQSQAPVPAPAPSPKPVPRIIDTTPFPTTFVQADTANFKQVVQRLTGSDTPPPAAAAAAQKPVKNSHGHHHSHSHHHHHGCGGGPKKPAFKLYERRIGKNNLKMIAPLAMAAAAAAGASPRTPAAPEVLSPSVLDFPSLALVSPVTPLLADPFNRSPASASASPGEKDGAAERAAIARKGFFLHPSPRAAAEPPRLLPLFPVTSPRMAPSHAAAAAPSPLQ